MRILLAGRMAVESDDHIVVDEASLGGRQVRLALSYLVLHRRRSVSRQELVDVLWPEEPPATWSSALRSVVSQVRSLLDAAGPQGGTTITSALGCYRVVLPDDAVVDVETVEAMVDAAEQAVHDGDLSAACEQALRVRHSRDRIFLVGDEGAWVEDVRADMRSWVARALEVLSDARLAQGHFDSAVTASREALAMDMLQESSYRRLMQCYARAGNRARALRCYEQCRTTLAEELGVRPTPETEALYLELLREEPIATAWLPSGRLPLPFPPAVVARTDSTFVGRGREQSVLREAWEESRTTGRQVVMVAGEVGAGKTVLSVKVGAEFHAQGAAVLYGRCDREAPFAYEPFIEALGRYVGRAPQGHPAPESGAVSELASLAVDQLQELAETSMPPGHGSQRCRQFSAVASFLASLLESGPVVLVLDDLQWACRPTLQLLRHLIRRLEAAQLLVIANHRDDEARPSAALLDTLTDLEREPGVRRLRLAGREGAFDFGEVSSVPMIDFQQCLRVSGRALSSLPSEQLDGGSTTCAPP